MPIPFPSDNGPHIPRPRHEQIDVLARMFGESEPGTDNHPEPGATVEFEVKWSGGRTRAQLKKFTPDEFAAYERARMDALPYVGKHVRHFDRSFEQWTTDDLTALIADMLATIRRCPPPARESFDARTYVGITRFNGRNDKNDRLHIYIGAGLEYRAEVDIKPVSIPEWAFAEFVAGLEPFQILISSRTRGVAMRVDEYKSIHWTPGRPDPDPDGGVSPFGYSRRAVGSAQPATASVDPIDGEEGDGEEDDLDAIEKAARRTLHGDKAIPPTSQQTTGPASRQSHSSRSSNLQRIGAMLACLQPRELGKLADFAEVLFTNHGGRR